MLCYITEKMLCLNWVKNQSFISDDLTDTTAYINEMISEKVRKVYFPDGCAG